MSKIARLFTIKTRTEVWFVIYAIALGAVERAQHYLHSYSGINGSILAIACFAVVFLAGAKLLDSVKPARRKSLPGRTLHGPSGAIGSFVIDP